MVSGLLGVREYYEAVHGSRLAELDGSHCDTAMGGPLRNYGVEASAVLEFIQVDQQCSSTSLYICNSYSDTYFIITVSWNIGKPIPGSNCKIFFNPLSVVWRILALWLTKVL